MDKLILAALATYGVATVLADYDGPFRVLAKLRDKAKMPDCAVCLSVWIAPLTLGLLAFGEAWVVYSLASVGIVIILDRSL